VYKSKPLIIQDHTWSQQPPLLKKNNNKKKKIKIIPLILSGRQQREKDIAKEDASFPLLAIQEAEAQDSQSNCNNKLSIPNSKCFLQRMG